MPKYYKIYNSKDIIFVTVDDSGAVIIKDSAGRKVFFSKYQAKLMHFGIDNLLKPLFDDSESSDVHVEEIKQEE